MRILMVQMRTVLFVHAQHNTSEEKQLQYCELGFTQSSATSLDAVDVLNIFSQH